MIFGEWRLNAHTTPDSCGLRWQMIIFCQYGGQGLELYCPVCQRIEYGVEKELFALANKFIKETEFN